MRSNSWDVNVRLLSQVWPNMDEAALCSFHNTYTLLEKKMVTSVSTLSYEDLGMEKVELFVWYLGVGIAKKENAEILIYECLEKKETKGSRKQIPAISWNNSVIGLGFFT